MFILSAVAAVGLLYLFWTWHVRRELRRSRAMLTEWAAKGGRKILSAERTLAFGQPTIEYIPGSGWFIGGTGRSTFQVAAEESDGRRHLGRVSISGSWWGIRERRVEAVWDE